MAVYTLIGAFLLASVHIFGERLAFLRAIPRSRWLSIAGGVSVAYVFIHILPELGRQQDAIEATGLLGSLELHVYIAALLGLSIFYGLERLVREDAARGRAKGSHRGAVFWLHIVSFAIYNGLVGYLLVQREGGSQSGLALYLVAIALHFIVNDHGLRQEHRRSYHRYARWLLAAAVVIGWAAGTATSVGAGYVGVLFALLAGGIILNVMKEELPEERRSQFWAFFAGAAGYTLVVLLPSLM